MGALAGEPWRGHARTNVLVAGAGFKASASFVDIDPSVTDGDLDGTAETSWQQTPGDVVTNLRIESAQIGTPVFGDPTDLLVQVRAPDGAQIGDEKSFNVVAFSWSRLISNFRFDANPLNDSIADALRWGMLEIYIRIRRVEAGLTVWEVDSRGTISNPPVGGTHDWARGYVRANGLISGHTISNVGLDGAEPTLWAFPDPIHTRLSLSAAAYESNTVKLGLRNPADTEERNSSVAGSAAVKDYSWTGTGGINGANRVAEGMSAAEETKSLRLDITTADFGGDNKYVFHSSGHQAGWVRDSELQMTRAGRVTIDPRLTHALHFQVDDDIFGTAKHDATKQMLATSSGFIWDITKNARGEGQNSIGITQTLDPQAPGTTQNVSATTSTQDGLAGVSGRMDWVASKPGGGWDWSIDVTSPADIDADTFEVGGTDTLTMLAKDPRIEPQVYLVPIATGGEDDHLHPGDQMRILATLWNNETRKRLTPDAGTVEMVLTRYNASLSRFEYLSSANVWTHWQGTTTAADSFALADAGDGVTFTTDFTNTSGWGTTDLIAAVIRAKVNSTPYVWKITRELVKKSNQHSGYALDSIGLALSGVLSQR